MARLILTNLDLNKNQLLNARIQNLAADPSSPTVGQVYFNTGTNRLRTFNGSTWDETGTSSGTGDASTNTATSVDSEIVLFNGTTGKSLKRATGTGIAKITSGVLGTATAGTDYVGPTSGSAIQKANGAGGLTPAVASTDYAPATTGSAILKGNSAGGFAAAASGTDYAPATATTSALKGNGSGGFAAATLNDVGAATADYSVNSHKLTNLLDPTSAQDAATKNYVDLAVQGITWKAPVRAATTTTGTLASAYANGSVIDGVTLATGDRILIKNQTTGTENGIYVVAASGAPTRATDADAGSELAQAATYVREGTTQADSAWVMTNDGTITIGTTSLTFVQFSQSGGVQSATTTTAGISRYATTAEAAAKSISTAAVTPAGLAPFTQKFSATIGDGTTTAIAVTHNLGTQDVHMQVQDATTRAVVECDMAATSTTVSTFTFAVAPATNAYRVIILG